MVEHPRFGEEGLGQAQCPAGIAGQKHALGERGRWLQVDGIAAHARQTVFPAGTFTRVDSAAMPGEAKLPRSSGGLHMSEFKSETEFREVMDRTFALMSEDPDMGPKLRDADTPQRFEFTDVDLVVNIRAGGPAESNLSWVWSDDIDWEPQVRMQMSSETANRYFQGKENIAIAIARRRIKAAGDVKAALAILPITKPLFARYRAMIAADYPHLED
jgi:hypothetical protein